MRYRDCRIDRTLTRRGGQLIVYWSRMRNWRIWASRIGEGIWNSRMGFMMNGIGDLWDRRRIREEEWRWVAAKEAHNQATRAKGHIIKGKVERDIWILEELLIHPPSYRRPILQSMKSFNRKSQRKCRSRTWTKTLISSSSTQMRTREALTRQAPSRRIRLILRLQMKMMNNNTDGNNHLAPMR